MDKEEFHWLFGVVQGWFSVGGAVPNFLSRDGAKLAKKYLLFPHIAEDTWDKKSPPNLPNASSAAQLSNHRN
jgi:hypothetical protein